MKNSLGTKLLLLVVTLALLTYFGWQGMRYFDDPLTTALAYAYEVEEGVDLSGYVVRREQVLEDGGGSLLRLQRAEGERVGAGGTVARVYASQSALDCQNEIEALQGRIEQLEYAQAAAVGSDVSLKLDAQILHTILQHRSSLAGDRLYDAEKQGQELRALVLKRDYTYSDNADLTGEITELRSQLKTLQSQAENSVRRITAPVSGLYSAVVDGYENVLTPDVLAELTPAKLSAVRAEDSSSQLGKLILGDYWYYVASMRAADAKELSHCKGLKLHFTKNVERELPVTIDSIGPEENGKVVVAFRGSTYLPELTLLRQQSAQVVRTVYDGIRVPKEALRGTRIRQDAEGNKVEEEALGLYCIVGVEARFKPVKILYNGDGFLLVQAVDSGSESTRLRPGDTVIITANDLFDGKIVSNA